MHGRRHLGGPLHDVFATHVGGGNFPFGPGGPPFMRGPKARRGDIRNAALLLLAEEPRNGYQIMQDVEQRSGGVWRARPGSVYPSPQPAWDAGVLLVRRGGGVSRYRI